MEHSIAGQLWRVRPSDAGHNARAGGQTRQRKLAVIVVAATCLVFQSIAAAPVREIRRVLVFYEWSTSGPGIALVDKEIRAALEHSPYQVELYVENLETNLFPSESSQQEARDWYIRKYQDHKPDLIIAEGQPSIRFIVESRPRFFPGTPVIFCCSPQSEAENLHLDSSFTGTLMIASPVKTLEAAVRLQPRTKRVVVVGGVSPFDRHVEEIVRQSLQKFQTSLEFTYLTDLEIPALLERLAHLPDQTVVLYTSLSRDAAGTPFVDAIQVVPMLANTANAPVFAMADSLVGRGTVGGHVCSYAEQGRLVGEMMLEILQGKTPREIPIAKDTNVYMFDWRALKRWGFRENDLPPGSIVLNRQQTAWEFLRWYIIGGISLMLVETLLIFGLVWQRSRRRKAEQKVRESEERFRLVANTAPVMIWMSGTDKLCNYFNQPWLEFTGRSLEAELGNGWSEGVHSEDLHGCLRTYKQAFDRRESFKMQYRLRRYDGEYRWVFDIGVPRFNPDASFAGFIGSCIDITERKLAEESVASLSGRLIEAQEEERRRIAREVHDDYTQQLAVLAMDLEDLAENIGSSPAEAPQRLHQLWNRVSELGADLHSLSHRLHSSTLESLGLVAGTSAFCEEFADQQEIQVEFVHGNVPRGIPGDVALCLFRITQEALRNIKRHSGANRAEVRLEVSGEGLHLSVADRGKGFDVNQRAPHDGIGLHSMAERLRLLGGRLEIHSQPMEGTRIDAWLPFKIAMQRAS